MIFLGLNMTILLVLYEGSNVVISGVMTTGQLTSFLIYSTYTAITFSGIGSIFSELVRSIGSSRRVLDILGYGRPSVARNQLKVVEKDKFKGVIRFEDVSFSYVGVEEGRARVLDGISFEIGPNSPTAFLGQSGSGKTTILYLCLNLYSPTSGRVYLDDVPVDEIDPHWLRRQVGVVPQEIVIFSGTVAENISYRMDASREDIVRAAKQANAHEFVDKLPLKYDTIIGDGGYGLSGGQRQRIIIARALVKDPKILLFDEAMSLLDLESECLIQESLNNLVKEKTILIVAHRLSTIKDAANIAVLENGKIVAFGNYQKLIDTSEYFRNLINKHNINE